jgi:hypothetical protein
MPPDRGRASRACTSCRKQKTRCYEPGIPGRACLRCDRLRQSCSLVRIDLSDEESVVPAPATGTDARYAGENPPSKSKSQSNKFYSLERLEKSVATLLDRLGEGPAARSPGEFSRPTTAQTSPVSDAYKEAETSAPIMVIRDLATDNGMKPVSDARSLMVVLDDLISPDLGLTLITMYVVRMARVGLLLTFFFLAFWNITVDGFFLTLNVNLVIFSAR